MYVSKSKAHYAYLKVDVYITENQFIAAKFSEKKINEIFKEKSIKLYQGQIQVF